MSPETDSGFMGSEASRVSPPVHTPEHRPPGTGYGSGSLPSPWGAIWGHGWAVWRNLGHQRGAGMGERWGAGAGCCWGWGCAGWHMAGGTSCGGCLHHLSPPQDPWLSGTLHPHPHHPPSSVEERGTRASPRAGADGHLPHGWHRGAPPAPQYPLTEQLASPLGRERGQRGGARRQQQ